MERADILKINSYLSSLLTTSCHLLSFLFAWCLRPVSPAPWLNKCYEAFQYVEVNE